MEILGSFYIKTCRDKQVSGNFMKRHITIFSLLTILTWTAYGQTNQDTIHYFSDCLILK